MARRGASLDELFDRPYRPGTAFGPRISPLRRWGMSCVLFLLVAVILTYWYLTDARRVRAMAENYLSQLTGSHVEVRNATLSIFEGLRLDGVAVRVDDHKHPDSLVFKAETLLIKYNPQSIFSGRLEATQIVALDPQVFVCENLDQGNWNWQRHDQEKKTTTRPARGPRLKFPEVLLRNAQIHYSRLRDGKLLHEQGVMEIEGSILPGNEGELGFRVQSRGEAQGIGPVVRGQYNVDTQVVSATLENFTFGKDIEVMLPEQVRAWWVQHNLSGSLDIPAFYVKPARNGEKRQFRIETDLKNVNLDIMPEEWLSREEAQRLAAMRRSLAFMKSAGLDANGFVSGIEGVFNPSPIELDKVAGRFTFTEEGIDIDRLSGWIEKNPFTINGRIEGYSPEAAVTLTVEGQNVTIPHAPRYLNAMPPAFRELYDHLKPEGDGSLWVKIQRPTPGAKPVVNGRIDILDGKFCFDEFPYPLRKVRGVITFGWDEMSQMDRVDVNLRGLGIADGPNRNVPVDVRGFVGPLGDGQAEVDFWVSTKNVTSEAALTNAYPKPAREALKIFDAPGKGEFPKYHGGFVCNVHRPYGPNPQKWHVTVDVELDDAAGSLVFFPYPVEHLTGKLRITEERVDIINATVKENGAALVVDGVVRFGDNKPLDPQLRISGQGILIDAKLLGALPKDRREWLEKLGIAGKLDLEGRVERDVRARAGAGSKNPQDDITYELQLGLSHGSFWPVDGRPLVRDVTGKMRLTPHELVVSEMKGRRGDAKISGNGMVSWPGGKPSVVISAAAKDLLLDEALRKSLPAAWREGWDGVRPEGSVNIDLTYSGGVEDAAGGATTRPAAGFQAVIQPVKLAITPRPIPVRIDDLKGTITIRPEQTTLSEMMGTRKSGGTVSFSGTVPTGSSRGAWNLKLSAKEIINDKELSAALPPALSKLLASMKFKGKLGVDFSKLDFRPGADPKSEDGELDFKTVITLAGNSFDAGVPLDDVNGTLTLSAGARRGKLAGLTGTMELSSLQLAERKVTNLRADLIKPESEDALRIGKIEGDIAGGKLAGQIDLLFPDKGDSRFGLGLVVRNADVTELAGQTEKDIQGSLSASLALEGTWGNTASRRGRGDVSVSGKQMYKIPLLLGLMQITNLSLPISSPFNEGAVRYSVEGEKVSFEQIELRASNMLMSGSGWLDFGTKKVRMTFLTDNPNAWKIPFISEILAGARQEFMQIQVSGTVQEPKVRGSLMNTFTTTVDEVLNNGKANKPRGK